MIEDRWVGIGALGCSTLGDNLTFYLPELLCRRCHEACGAASSRAVRARGVSAHGARGCTGRLRPLVKRSPATCLTVPIPLLGSPGFGVLPAGRPSSRVLPLSSPAGRSAPRGRGQPPREPLARAKPGPRPPAARPVCHVPGSEPAPGPVQG